MAKVIAFLSGKKSYIGVVAGGILWTVWQLGYVPNEMAGIIAGVIMTWTGVSFRTAIGKGEL